METARIGTAEQNRIRKVMTGLLEAGAGRHRRAGQALVGAGVTADSALQRTIPMRAGEVEASSMQYELWSAVCAVRPRAASVKFFPNPDLDSRNSGGSIELRFDGSAAAF